MVDFPYPEIEHDARVLCGDPIACAYEWMNGYVSNLNDQITCDNNDDDADYRHSLLTLDEMIDIAMGHVESKSAWGGEYINKGGVFEGISVDPTFWEKLALFKEIDIPQDKRNNFFSCSC